MARKKKKGRKKRKKRGVIAKLKSLDKKIADTLKKTKGGIKVKGWNK